MRRGLYQRWANRLAVVGAAGLVLLIGGCTVDQELATEITNLVLEAILTAITSS
ncbi:MAG: hypothetical protein JXB13_11240 [Phycisphaerae bacterium]|nr:hypothetical protein [Phycisphaerae bacterium]